MRHRHPHDLAQARQEWSATYRRLAEQPGRTGARGRLYRPSTAAFRHAHRQERKRTPAAWTAPREPGRAAVERERGARF
ncbi:hypothetical protein ACFV3F_29510 [Streptomyces sp. NPDC059717]|uniref:hypothetical protein n=1 Tax=Streptomyces sp. NPDC059717 TaxID=3346922 RepID=UPI00368F2418